MVGIQHAEEYQSDGALFVRSESAQAQSPTGIVASVDPGALCSTERERSGVDSDAMIDPDQERPSTSAAYNSEESPAAVASTSASDAPATPSTFGGPRRTLVRQVTFGVQTEFTPGNLPDSVLQNDDEGANVHNDLNATPRETTCCRRLIGTLDGAFLCYGVTGSLLVAFGGVVLYLVVVGDSSIRDPTTAEEPSQLWILGPIFICSGVLVCIKAFSHIYNRLHPERRSGQLARGAFLTSDSRPSLNRQPSLPPNYSVALQAPVPSGVLEEEDKLPEPPSDADAASLARVTINFDPLPPTYTEAMVVLRRETLSNGPLRSAVSSPVER